DDPELAQLRGRKKQRERVELAVRNAIGALAYHDAVALLREGGIGFTEVVPVERVLDNAQAQQPGKLRTFTYRGLTFQTPELPGQAACADGLPPPELGEHTIEILEALGYDESERAKLLGEGAVVEATSDRFTWAVTRREG